MTFDRIRKLQTALEAFIIIKSTEKLHVRITVNNRRNTMFCTRTEKRASSHDDDLEDPLSEDKNERKYS